MSLGFSQDPEERLSPEVTRAFLEIHAQRESKATEPAPDAPTVRDLEESLRLAPEEAREILREARARVRPRLEPASTKRPVAAALLGLGLMALILSVSLLTARSSIAPIAPPAVAMTGTATPADMATMTSSLAVGEPPPGFAIQIVGPGGETLDRRGSSAKFGTDFSRLSPSDLEGVKARLVEASLEMLGAVDSSPAWSEATTLTVDIRILGGKPTALAVPVKPFTFPFGADPAGRNDLKATLGRVVDLAWPSIVRAGPFAPPPG